MGPGRIVLLISSLVLAGATSALGQPIADGDSSIPDWIHQATQHMAVDEWDQAAALWSKVIAADSRHVVAHLNRAMSFYRAGNCAGRRADAQQALSLLDDRAVAGELEHSHHTNGCCGPIANQPVPEPRPFKESERIGFWTVTSARRGSNAGMETIDSMPSRSSIASCSQDMA